MYHYYKGVLAYDGTEYKGWQLQREGIPTVQGMMERAVSRIFVADRIPVNGASRTDSGVHARGQVFNSELRNKSTLTIYSGAATHSFLPISE